MYAREESASGWNIISKEHTLACKVAEAQYAKLAATFKNKSVPDSESEYFQGQVANGRSSLILVRKVRVRMAGKLQLHSGVIWISK